MDLKLGDCFSTDHYIAAIPWRLPNTYGRERQGYTCGTLCVDHASGKIFNYCQTSMSDQDTIKNKHCLELLTKNEGFSLKSYHSEYGMFASDAYKSDCDAQNKKYTFSGVGAHRQNGGAAEPNIKTSACTNLVHQAFWWAGKESVWYCHLLLHMQCGSLIVCVCPNELWYQVSNKICSQTFLMCSYLRLPKCWRPGCRMATKYQNGHSVIVLVCSLGFQSFVRHWCLWCWTYEHEQVRYHLNIMWSLMTRLKAWTHREFFS